MILTQNLTKNYGKVRALRGISIRVNEGDIYGLIGPNGAGKSTLFRILSTIDRPTTGHAMVGGVPLSKGDKIRGMIGYMPDVFGVYEDMTVWEYLDFFAAAYYIPGKRRGRLIRDVLDLTDLGFKRGAMVKALSRGMQQRLGVARVLVHDPKVLILDEPASGLDPRARVELRELLKELRNLGKTILISSHILVELAQICNRIGIIESGSLAFEGTRGELNEKLHGRAALCIEVTSSQEEAVRFLKARDGVVEVDVREEVIHLRLDDGGPTPEDILAELIEKGIRVLRFDPDEVTLEEAFMVLTRGKLA
jgi:ABC-2 type transport system ATP-binding protein